MFCSSNKMSTFRNYLRAILQNQKFASWPPSNNVPSWFSSFPIPQLVHQFGLNLLQCDHSVSTNQWLRRLFLKIIFKKKLIYNRPVNLNKKIDITTNNFDPNHMLMGRNVAVIFEWPLNESLLNSNKGATTI